MVIVAWKITQKFVSLKFNMKMGGKLYKRWASSKPVVESGKPVVKPLCLVVGRVFLLAAFSVWLTSFLLHPYYMSVTELEFKPAEKEIQISTKIFIDDLEFALQEEYKTKVEILNAANKKKNEALLNQFFQKHLKLSVDGKPVSYQLIGFEREEEAIWTYLVVKNISKLKSATVFIDLLYNYRDDQINIIHFKNNNDRKSHRLTYPDKQVSFNW